MKRLVELKKGDEGCALSLFLVLSFSPSFQANGALTANNK